ncbi:hypothetical protein [Paenibacillus hunanensis]|uniref:DNA-directed RNA polymerase subunit RPC12/RpoP n=1 Tax=Paenibacillus hunanensis TaxID=539262 RepID=A0ABU1J5P6_9BACL|nr:hypothetical protein [Paenibacillus hunanensis]MDR6246541.1 DNA-directed RNA polymerase subunit RPC12/RpoP [Paenibacillus hunanensis]GGJ31898.1 hypothetical protein GCM10008022_45690 [Paenibacillus hunanensis]
MERRSHEEVLKDIEMMQTIRKRVMNGDNVSCPKCGERLIFLDKNSGKHPGIFCPNGDFEILIEYDGL